MSTLLDFTPEVVEIRAYQGDDLDVPLVISVNSVAQDITLWTLTAQVRAAAGDAVEASFSVVKTDAANGAVTISIDATTSAGIAAGTYQWDLQRVVSAKTRTLVTGPFRQTGDITR